MFNAAALWTPECGVTANVKKLGGRMKKPLLNATLMEKKKCTLAETAEQDLHRKHHTLAKAAAISYAFTKLGNASHWQGATKGRDQLRNLLRILHRLSIT